MVPDKLTQLQVLLDSLGRLFVDSIGSIQRDAPPAPIYRTKRKKTPQQLGVPSLSNEHIANFAKDIVNISKQIEEYIDSLPGIESSEIEQLNKLEELEIENKRLEYLILEKKEEAEEWHLKVIKVLQNISDGGITSDINEQL